MALQWLHKLGGKQYGSRSKPVDLDLHYFQMNTFIDNSSPLSDSFCYILIDFANSSDSEQA